jgi:hypothetical protein
MARGKLLYRTVPHNNGLVFATPARSDRFSLNDVAAGCPQHLSLNPYSVKGEILMAKNADSPGVKSARTKGPIERKRAAQAAAWTKKHGNDDAKNPYSKRNNP